MAMMKPQTMMDMFKNMLGEEKAEAFMELCKLGLFNRPIIIMTSMYVKDKDNFLLVKTD